MFGLRADGSLVFITLGPDLNNLEWPNRPEPAVGPLKKAVFLIFFSPIPYYLGSNDSERLPPFFFLVITARAFFS
jgi:hypothetical protein